MIKKIVLYLLLQPVLAIAQEPQCIRDNSFLLEEGFNQEKGVIQHIALLRQDNSRDASHFSFTEEWPVFSEKHQLSVTLNAENIISGEGFSGLSNMMINYRYQLWGGEKIFIAPRISGILPVRSGSIVNKSTGFEINFPVSIILSESWILHFNAGGNFLETKTDNSSVTVSRNSSFSGTGIIFQPGRNFNLMNEIMYSIEESTVIDAVPNSALTWNPGFRVGVNFKSGLQIVPGFSVPVEFSNGEADAGMLFYLSFEHSISKEK